MVRTSPCKRGEIKDEKRVARAQLREPLLGQRRRAGPRLRSRPDRVELGGRAGEAGRDHHQPPLRRSQRRRGGDWLVDLVSSSLPTPSVKCASQARDRKARSRAVDNRTPSEIPGPVVDVYISAGRDIFFDE